MVQSSLTIITAIWRSGEKNLRGTPRMEFPLVNESQDLNSNLATRVQELAAERTLVVRIKRIIENSCTSLVTQKSSCLWAMLFGLSYCVSWNSWWKHYIYCGQGRRILGLTWSSLAVPVQVKLYAQDLSLAQKHTGTEWSASLLLNSLVLQNIVSTSKL